MSVLRGRRALVPFVTVFAVVTACVAAARAGRRLPQRPLGTILGADSPDAIAGEYIVAVQPFAVGESTTVTLIAQSLTAANGGTVGYVYDGLGMFALSGTDVIAQQIAADPRVKYVNQNQRVSLAVLEDNPD